MVVKSCIGIHLSTICFIPTSLSQDSNDANRFVEQLNQIFQLEQELLELSLEGIDEETLRRSKEYGFSDRQLASFWDCQSHEVREVRERFGISTTFRLVDTCAAEFEAYTPYFYSSYGDENEISKSDKRKIMIDERRLTLKENNLPFDKEHDEDKVRGSQGPRGGDYRQKQP